MTGPTMEVKGVKEALAILNAMDKKTRRQITKDFAEIAKPMVVEAKRMLPGDAPMSGWNRSYRYNSGTGDALLPWLGSAEARSVKAFTSGSKKKAAVFGMKWNSRAATLFDMAGKSNTPQGAQMINVLTSRYGSPSRTMWKAYEAASSDVQDQMRKLVEKIMNESSYALRYRAGKTTVAKIVKVI
jgi:hypothetical protein